MVQTETLGTPYLALPGAVGPHPGAVVVHEAFGLNDKRPRHLPTARSTDNWVTAIAPFYGVAPKPRQAIRRLCPNAKGFRAK